MKTTVWVRLDFEVKAGAQDPFDAVDEALDDGSFQDSINGGGLKIVSALSLSTGDVEASLNEEPIRLLSALLGAMPPALQRKWPNITKRAAALLKERRS